MWSTLCKAVTLLPQPRTLLTKLGQEYFHRHPARPGERAWVQRHFRKWCTDQELPVWTRRHFQMRVSPRDYASYGIFFFGEYDEGMSTVVSHQVREGHTAWDVGAERGWFTLLMGRLVGRTGRVDAVEAFPLNFARLQANIALNKMSWVHPHHAAASDGPGQQWFVPPSDEITGHTDYLAHCSGVGHLTRTQVPHAIRVPTLALDDLAERERLTRLDFIKLDIEGAELAALRGAERVLHRFRPVLAIEYNWSTARRAGTSVRELDDWLAAHHYERYVYVSSPVRDRCHAGAFSRLDLATYERLPVDEQVINVYGFPEVR